MHSNNIQWNDERHTPMLNNYRAIVASWIYDMNTCAPYAATALLYLCMSMQTPTREDALALDAFMCYMAKNIDPPFVIQRPSVVGGNSISTCRASLTQVMEIQKTPNDDQHSDKSTT